MVSKVIPVSTKKVCAICGKPLAPSSGEIGDTCKEHEGKLRQTAQVATAAPEGYVRMSKVCQAALDKGIKISAVVTASGGDACTKPLMDPIFQVVYVGRAKYMNPEVLTRGFALLLAHKDEPKPAKLPKATQAAEISGKLQSVVK